jgi:hypothetical protein
MVHLTLAGLSDDGKRLLLVSDQGVEFTLDADERLRAALRGDHARLGQLEITMDSTLRPRDIQARIRAGESPEAVAQAAQTSVDKIMPFAAPVMAERQHVAQRAQRSSVRRTGQTGGARTLGDAVAAHLRSANVDPDGVEWDAARREDGRWALTAEFGTPARSGLAKFTYDAPGNYVVADNDDAGWLLGDLREPAAEPRSGDDLTRARARRLSAVSDSELPLDHELGDDAISMVTDETATIGTEQPVEAYLDDRSPAEPPAAREAAPADPVETADPVGEVDDADQDATDSDEDPAPEPTRKKPSKKRGRASVPSWDEIMFGGSSGSDRG